MIYHWSFFLLSIYVFSSKISERAMCKEKRWPLFFLRLAINYGSALANQVLDLNIFPSFLFTFSFFCFSRLHNSRLFRKGEKKCLMSEKFEQIIITKRVSEEMWFFLFVCIHSITVLHCNQKPVSNEQIVVIFFRCLSWNSNGWEFSFLLSPANRTSSLAHDYYGRGWVGRTNIFVYSGNSVPIII